MQTPLRFFAALALTAAVASAAGELSNRRAPGFSLPDLQLQQHDLNDYAGKVVVLNIMRTGCPHCAAFSKVLDGAREKYGSSVKVLSIVNPPDTQATVKQYLAASGVSTTFLFDCGQAAASYLKIGPANPSFQVPHFFVIDAKGWIREDYGYNLLSKNIFEGDGIYRILDKYVAGARADD